MIMMMIVRGERRTHSEAMLVFDGREKYNQKVYIYIDCMGVWL